MRFVHIVERGENMDREKVIKAVEDLLEALGAFTKENREEVLALLK